MNADVKKLWVDALRSGEYKQGFGSLKSAEDKNTFCCLGVLCEIAVQQGVIPAPEGVFYCGIYDEILPDEVCEFAGLDTDCPSIGGHTLTHLNDDEGFNFESIAQLIEDNL